MQVAGANHASSPGKLPSLDGWRAISILLVLGDHCKYVWNFPPTLRPLFTWIFNGNLGVRCFFVISGFLITYLLLREHDRTGGISLRRFYARRVLRIFPVYYFFLLTVFLIQIASIWHQSQIEWLSNLFFITNFSHGPAATSHLWSLAVEEQFYLLWPVTLYLIGPKNRRGILGVLCIPMFITPICRLLKNSHWLASLPPFILPLFKNYSFLFYFDSLAVGCAAAVILVRQEKLARRMADWKFTLLAFILFVATYCLSQMHLVEWFTNPLGNIVQAIALAILLLQSILFPQYFRPLNWPVVQRLGVLSFSIYIWQMLFCANPVDFGWPNFWFMSIPGWLPVALLAAVLSYYCLEKPLLAWRERLRKAN